MHVCKKKKKKAKLLSKFAKFNFEKMQNGMALLGHRSNRTQGFLVKYRQKRNIGPRLFSVAISTWVGLHPRTRPTISFSRY